MTQEIKLVVDGNEVIVSGDNVSIQINTREDAEVTEVSVSENEKKTAASLYGKNHPVIIRDNEFVNAIKNIPGLNLDLDETSEDAINKLVESVKKKNVTLDLDEIKPWSKTLDTPRKKSRK